MAKQPKPKTKNIKSGAEVTSVSQWKKKAALAGPEPLELPSGNVCITQPIGIPQLLSKGLIPNPLVATVMSALELQDDLAMDDSPAARAKAEAKQQEQLQLQMQDMVKDPEKIEAFFQMIDNITVACVVEPPVSPLPPNGDARNPELLYVDEVDFEDRMFIMSNAMSGVRDLESFRDAVGSSMDDVPAVPDAGDQA